MSKKNYRKIGNKKETHICVKSKTNKDEYVKSIIYLYFFCKKKKGIKKTIIMWQMMWR